MINRFRTIAGASALLAAAGMAMPGQAAPISAPGAQTSHSAVAGWSVEDETAHGWGHHRRWRRDRIDGGDVLAGILILGGVVAIAKAAEKSSERRYRERDERYRDYPDRDADYHDRRYDDRYAPRYADSSRRGIDGAIEDCVYEVERRDEVRSVDTAERDGSGWRVEGDLAEGGRYECSIGSDGRVRDIDIEGEGRSYGARDAVEMPVERAEGYDDDYYANARARSEEVEAMPEPAGKEEDERDWRRGESDDRYQTAQGPDFALAN